MITQQPAPMSDEAAAWIREHVWTQKMRKTFAEVPGFYLRCSCQSGLTTWCQTGNHTKCHRATPQPTHETSILRRGGTHPAMFAVPLFHRTPTATGGHRMSEAQVWLGDRVCAWRCPCDCHDDAPARIDKPVQLDLFAALTA